MSCKKIALSEYKIQELTQAEFDKEGKFGPITFTIVRINRNERGENFTFVLGGEAASMPIAVAEAEERVFFPILSQYDLL